MIASKLFITLGVSLSVNAFSLYESGTDKNVTKACDKAMSADIDCDREDWIADVSEDCEDQDKARGGLRIWTGWNATCLKDTKTGRYCNDIIADFTDVGEGEELPHDELCHPCYVQRLEMYKPSPYALNIKWHEEQLELVHKKCDSSTSTDTAAPTSSKSEPPGAATTAEDSKASQTANSEEGSVSSTGTLAQTISSEPTVSSTPNAAAESVQGEMFGSRALMLLLSLNLFFI
ncbi:hypothetical protein LB503_010217 [Fusarium chuoi]|nr:hypothetical protein LB503_010217 [Fusarium chuoi]